MNGTKSGDYKLISCTQQIALAVTAIVSICTPSRSRVFAFTCLPSLMWIVAGVAVSMLVPVEQLLAQSPNTRVIQIDSKPAYDEAFRRRYYAGFGVGSSRLEPDTSEIQPIDVDTRDDVGFQLALGVDFSRAFSVELHTASLGEAVLTNEQALSYQQVGLSALYYMGGARNRFNRRGFTGYGRVGVGRLINEADDDLEFEQDNLVHITLGLGAEYATRMGLAFRAEVLTFGRDVSYAQFGLLYRFGHRSDKSSEYTEIKSIKKETPVIAPVETQVEVEAQVKTPIETSVKESEEVKPDTPTPPASEESESTPATDRNGNRARNETDPCANAIPGLSAGDPDCVIKDGVLEGVIFRTGSSELTPEALTKLDIVADALIKQPSIKVEVSAHTDNVGSEEENEALAIKRAKRVAIYLINAGVKNSQLAVRSFGERRPITSNDTAEGRQTNRRIEIKTIR